MKKFITFLIIALAAFAVPVISHAQAQYGAGTYLPTVAGDTLTNADSVAKVIKVTGGFASLGIQVILKQASGSLTGKVYLFKSGPDRTYILVDSASYTAVPAGASGSAFGANSGGYTHTASFSVTSPPFVNYLVLPVSTASVSAPLKVWYALRKYNTE